MCICIRVSMHREARKYVDKMCVRYEKSLLESGTMGTSGNVDTICPFKTQTYGMCMYTPFTTRICLIRLYMYVRMYVL